MSESKKASLSLAQQSKLVMTILQVFNKIQHDTSNTTIFLKYVKYSQKIFFFQKKHIFVVDSNIEKK